VRDGSERSAVFCPHGSARNRPGRSSRGGAGGGWAGGGDLGGGIGTAGTGWTVAVADRGRAAERSAGGAAQRRGDPERLASRLPAGRVRASGSDGSPPSPAARRRRWCFDDPLAVLSPVAASVLVRRGRRARRLVPGHLAAAHQRAAGVPRHGGRRGRGSGKPGELTLGRSGLYCREQSRSLQTWGRTGFDGEQSGARVACRPPPVRWKL